MDDIIPFEDWKKLDIRVGRILNAEDIPNADKLYKLEVNVGEEKPRTLVAGIKKHYTKEELKNKMCIVFCNLEPRVMKGIKSEGMILAAVSEDENEIAMLMPDKEAKIGSRIR